MESVFFLSSKIYGPCVLSCSCHVKRTETQPRKELGIWKLEIQISSGVQGIRGTWNPCSPVVGQVLLTSQHTKGRRMVTQCRHSGRTQVLCLEHTNPCCCKWQLFHSSSIHNEKDTKEPDSAQDFFFPNLLIDDGKIKGWTLIHHVSW